LSILIAGGTGFIGLSIAEEALRRGDDVVLYDPGAMPEVAAKVFDSLDGSWSHVPGSVTDREQVADAMKQHSVSRVFYGAALTSGPDREREHPEQVLSVNLVGLAAVTKAAADSGAERLLNISSGAAYGTGGFGDTGWTGMLDEEGTREDPLTLYAVSKYATERVARRVGELNGLDVLSVRLSAIFGPWERDTGLRDTLSSPMQASVIALQGGEATLSYREARDWTYSRDVAKALMALIGISDRKHRTYNIGSGVEWSTLDWCERLAKRYPDFSYRMAEAGETPTVNLHSDRDRITMDPRRLREDVGEIPSGDVDALFADFETWLDEADGYWA
jgi:UDP-glucose 4-epimerase